MPSDRRWINPSQPQTLVFATWLLYFNAALTLVFFGDAIFYVLGFCGGSFGCGRSVDILRILLPAAYVGGAYGIANERRWGYYLGIAAACVPLSARLLFSFRTQSSPLSTDFIGLAFDIALVVLLLHTMSRSYQKIWFK